MTTQDTIATGVVCFLVAGALAAVVRAIWRERKNGWLSILCAILFPYKRQDFCNWRWGYRSGDMFFAYALYYCFLIIGIVAVVKLLPIFFRYLLR